MLYFTITLQCPHCRCAMPGAVVAETEPPPDTHFTIRCPSHNGPHRVAFRHFKQVDERPPHAHPMHYPPKPARSRNRWWHFWRH